ncbi:MAG: FkbM family methyltransferase [Minwuia sp.]|nr:FkbM family methyltransferase [Minwuia sp.]
MTDVREMEPPFGTHRLPGPLERLRAMTMHLPANRVGRALSSLVRRIVSRGPETPIDAEVFPGIRLRLRPGTNRCEKRVLTGAQFYDHQERAALATALNSSDSQPFVFADLGANVGLYSLWMVASARASGRDLQVLAVEPDRVTRGRLLANLAASHAGNVTVAPVAVGGAVARGTMMEHGNNRGENQVTVELGGGGDGFEILPLHMICERFGVHRIDAMKVDLEGHDEVALQGMFADAPRALWPGLLVVEAGKGETAPAVVQLCEAHGYRMAGRTRLNALMQRTD